MQEFFTWSMLATYAGATAATGLVTQMLKGAGVFAKIPTQIFSGIVALILLLAAHFATGELTLASAGLCVVNAVIVSLASNGAFEAMQRTAGER